MIHAFLCTYLTVQLTPQTSCSAQLRHIEEEYNTILLLLQDI